METILLATLAAALAGFTFVWFLSLKLGDLSIADLYWGPGFLVITLVALDRAPGASDGDRFIAILVGIWGLRLGYHLLTRWLKHKKEDPRYTAMRRARGPSYGWTSLFSVFWLQGAAMWLVSLPIQFAIGSPDTADAIGIPLLGILLFGIGFAFEATADNQLARFRADPANKGRVMDRGLWALTRHPNYFGDVCLWWGLFGLSVAGGAPWWTIVAPVAMTVLILWVSGVPMLERGLEKTKPGYADYARRTSAFLPWFPKKP